LDHETAKSANENKDLDSVKDQREKAGTHLEKL
jgi:hypothetical protein